MKTAAKTKTKTKQNIYTTKAYIPNVENVKNNWRRQEKKKKNVYLCVCYFLNALRSANQHCHNSCEKHINFMSTCDVCVYRTVFGVFCMLAYSIMQLFRLHLAIQTCFVPPNKHTHTIILLCNDTFFFHLFSLFGVHSIFCHSFTQFSSVSVSVSVWFHVSATFSLLEIHSENETKTLLSISAIEN